MIDACSGGKGRTAMEPAIQFLLSYVDKHFAHEEQLQQMNNYPDIAAHTRFAEKQQGPEPRSSAARTTLLYCLLNLGSL